jgi:hypothetical protein
LNDTTVVNGTTVMDFSHCNAIQWDYDNNVVYLNSRCLNAFYKINMTTGDIIWTCGLNGNFTLLDANGNKVTSLWYHSRALQQIKPDVFTMFDKDYDNLTNPSDAHSRLLEVTLDEQNMIARESWSWEAPQEYWSYFWGEADTLPNEDRIGTFGTYVKPYSNLGAVLVEVNQTGQVVRTWTFPSGWGIYRAIPIEAPVTGQNSNSGGFNAALVAVAVIAVAATSVICAVALRAKKRPRSKASDT